MKITGAQAVVECLKNENVEVIFGIPGGATIPLYDVLYESDVRHVLCRHEQGAAHAADGYARASGKVGVCCATSGPGATNLVTGIANAYMDSVPLVAMTGQVPTTSIGRDAFQEADTFGITMPIVKHSYLVQSSADIPQTLHDAFYIARTGRPGPVLVDFPRDVFLGELEMEGYPQTCAHEGYKPTTRGNVRAIRRAAEAINQAKRPLMYVGGGAMSANAHPEVVALAEKLNCPVFTTLMGKGCFPETHPLSLGMAGMHGTAYANYAIHECDLLLAIGARFDDRVTGRLDSFAPHAKVVHIDVDPAEIGKNVPATYPIVGDCKLVLQELIEHVNPREPDEWNKQCEEWKEKYPLKYEMREDGVVPQYVIEELYKLTRGEAIIVTDVGQNQMWAAQFYKTDKPRHFISSGGLGTMGYSLPASVGAQVARPGELVCCVTGDGGFQMTIQELTTAVVQKLPIKIILLNNQYLGMVRQWQTLFYDNRLSAVDLEGNPDFVKLADAYGAVGMRVMSNDEVRGALEKALEIDDRPCVIEFCVVRTANVMPMIPAGGTVKDIRFE